MNPIATQLKTGKKFELLGYAINCTDETGTEMMAIYFDPLYEDLFFTRELTDFKKNFTVETQETNLDRLDRLIDQPNQGAIMLNEIQEQLNNAGYDNAVAIATQAEIEAGAACGQLATIVEASQAE